MALNHSLETLFESASDISFSQPASTTQNIKDEEHYGDGAATQGGQGPKLGSPAGPLRSTGPCAPFVFPSGSLHPQSHGTPFCDQELLAAGVTTQAAVRTDGELATSRSSCSPAQQQLQQPASAEASASAGGSGGRQLRATSSKLDCGADGVSRVTCRYLYPEKRLEQARGSTLFS